MSAYSDDAGCRSGIDRTLTAAHPGRCANPQEDSALMSLEPQGGHAVLKYIYLVGLTQYL